MGKAFLIEPGDIIWVWEHGWEEAVFQCWGSYHHETQGVVMLETGRVRFFHLGNILVGKDRPEPQ